MVPCDTPIAFLIFNRPAVTEQVFRAIAAARPSRLLIVADGPRADHPEDAQLCIATREIVQKIDWPCKVETSFAETNLGCGKRVSSGLEWVFECCEEAIILEDDCLPHPDFFFYCQSMLERYRGEPRIMTISGDNFHGDSIRYPGSYYFSRFPHIWGWATWRRAWKLYDFKLATWPQWRDQRLSELFADPGEQDFWRQFIEKVYTGKLDTWDAQWAYAMLTHDGLAINPAKNLISNIGFGKDATHTFGTSWMSNLPMAPIGELHHPPSITEHRTADARTFKVCFDGEHGQKKERLPLLNRWRDAIRK